MSRIVKDIVGIKSVDTDRRRITFIASHELPDRDGEVVRVAGIDTSDFMKNPVLLANHDSWFSIGKITFKGLDRTNQLHRPTSIW